MKSQCLVLFFIFITTTLFAQNDSIKNNGITNTSATAADTANMARVYIIRSTGHVGSAVNLRIYVDGQQQCKVKNNHYSLLWVQPGTHMFNATTWDKPGINEKFSLKVPVEAGKTYYMTARIKTRFVGVEITLEEITFNTAGPLLEKYKQDACD